MKGWAAAKTYFFVFEIGQTALRLRSLNASGTCRRKSPCIAKRMRPATKLLWLVVSTCDCIWWGLLFSWAEFNKFTNIFKLDWLTVITVTDVLPQKIVLAATVPEEFHFNTNTRSKAVASTSTAHKEVDFMSQLRKPSSPVSIYLQEWCVKTWVLMRNT